MKIFALCECCGRKALFIQKRTYVIPHVGTATSQREICRKCYTGIKKINRELITAEFDAAEERKTHPNYQGNGRRS